MQFGAHFGGQSTNDFVMHVYASNVCRVSGQHALQKQTMF